MSLLAALLAPRPARIGLGVLAASIIAVGVWLAMARPDACGYLGELEALVGAHRGLGFALLFGASLVIFLTLMPLGSTTVMVAGYFLGPLAGWAQFGSLLLASAILYETAREGDHLTLEARLEAFPRVRALAGLARRNEWKFVLVTRLFPLVPSAAASLGAAYFSVSRPAFYGGMLLSGWVRPVAFGLIGAGASAVSVCGG